MVMQEMPTPKPAFILKRGAYDAHGTEVTADTPGHSSPFPAERAAQSPRPGALAARSGAIRSTARVAVNRLWQMMFGRGIVETSDNFGTQGTPPTHPELLDWLAPRLHRERLGRESGAQADRALARRIGKSSKAPPELLARDPANACSRAARPGG